MGKRRGWVDSDALSPAQRAQVAAQLAGRPFDPNQKPDPADAIPDDAPSRPRGRRPGPKRAPAARADVQSDATSPRAPRRPKASDEPSKPERDFRDYIELQRVAGLVQAWSYKPLKLFLAEKTTYEPDFAVLPTDAARIELVEVKGASSSSRSIAGAWWEEDARVKWKAAAQRHGVLFRFVAVHYEPGRGWVREEFEPRVEP